MRWRPFASGRCREATRPAGTENPCAAANGLLDTNQYEKALERGEARQRMEVE